MPLASIALLHTGLVTSIGQDAASACAAMRAKLANPTETRFMGSDGEWIQAHQVELESAERGLEKLAVMAALSIEECLAGVPRAEWAGMPLLLCVAERERPGRLAGLDERLFARIQQLLEVQFARESAVVAHGRVATAVALGQARKLILEQGLARVLVAAADGLLHWPTLRELDRAGRLLGPDNSNGFMPGEAAGALLLGAPSATPQLLCHGIGFGVEAAHIASDEPLRADGLTTAIKAALADAGCALHDIDYRMADLSGEQYYFKEAALAMTRTLRQRKEEFDLWHPAESIGETGASAGIAMLALADMACRKAFSPGPRLLAHMANDGGQRAAAIFSFGTAA
jgi:3-oxoacyl-[acyl-carrier-protein] synthase-1